MKQRSVVGTLVMFLSLSGCRREERYFNEPPTASRLNANAGSAKNDERSLVLYAEDAWAMSEGQRLYSQMNCSGCHAHGGGGIGPPLMDSEWLYGSALADIERSILGGRPNGMPAFGNRLSPQQVWQLVAYVRSLSGMAPPLAAPVRDDHMAVSPPPSRTKPQPVVQQKVD